LRRIYQETVVAMYESSCAHRVLNISNRLTFEDLVNEKYFEQSRKLTCTSDEKPGLVTDIFFYCLRKADLVIV